MANAAMTMKLFPGAFVHIAEYSSGASDSATKPIAASALWEEFATVLTFAHRQEKFTDPYDAPHAERAWAARKDEFTLADVYTFQIRTTNEIYERLRMGLASAITPGTAQTPHTVSDRMVEAWLKFQARAQTGSDHHLADLYGELRVMDEGPIEKGVIKPTFELWAIGSTLDSINYPDLYS